MANTVDKVIAVATAEIGYHEKASNKNLYDKTANSGSANYTKYGYEMHKIYPAVMDFPAPWCDCFVDWCMQVAYGISNAKKLLAGNFDDYTVYSANLYKNKGAWHTGKDVLVGDQIFFKNSKGICHTGLVVDASDSAIKTIEGNVDNEVGYHTYKIGAPSVAGYGRPLYDSNKIKSHNTTSADVYVVKSGDTLSKIAADNHTTVAQLAYANGITNPNKINVGQKIKLTASAPTVKTYTVRTNSGVPLRLRKTANGTIITTMPNGSKVTSDGTYTNGWLKVTYKGITGWYSKLYLR